MQSIMNLLLQSCNQVINCGIKKVLVFFVKLLQPIIVNCCRQIASKHVGIFINCQPYTWTSENLDQIKPNCDHIQCHAIVMTLNMWYLPSFWAQQPSDFNNQVRTNQETNGLQTQVLIEQNSPTNEFQKANQWLIFSRSIPIIILNECHENLKTSNFTVASSDVLESL
jgi:hypothetical protein